MQIAWFQCAIALALVCNCLAFSKMQLNRLLATLPYLQQEFPDPADFWPAFAGLADLIIDAAGPDDFDWVACQINAMLEARGLLVR